MRTAPCKDCPDRKLVCHGYCEKYKAFHEHNRGEHVLKAREQEKELCDYSYNAVARTKRDLSPKKYRGW